MQKNKKFGDKLKTDMTQLTDGNFEAHFFCSMHQLLPYHLNLH